jgi:hypothetical protein
MSHRIFAVLRVFCAAYCFIPPQKRLKMIESVVAHSTGRWFRRTVGAYKTSRKNIAAQNTASRKTSFMCKYAHLSHVSVVKSQHMRALQSKLKLAFANSCGFVYDGGDVSIKVIASARQFDSFS